VGSDEVLNIVCLTFPERNKDMILKRFYRHGDVNTGTVRAIRDALRSTLDWVFAKAEYRLYYPGEEFTLHKIDDVGKIAKERGQPASLWVALTSEGGRTFVLDARNPKYVTIEVNNLEDPPYKVFDTIEPDLKLEVMDNVPTIKTVVSAFVAHVFSDEGHSCANEVSHFLELNGIRPYSGRSFAPTSISDKVQARLAKHDIVIAILTDTDDPTWLMQEMAAAVALNKPLFILKQEDVKLKAGILGDIEYIPFPKGQISKTFIPILEGLMELRGEAS
jgi:hypothetical protein